MSKDELYGKSLYEQIVVVFLDVRICRVKLARVSQGYEWWTLRERFWTLEAVDRYYAKTATK